jgi:hypothetical protein
MTKSYKKFRTQGFRDKTLDYDQNARGGLMTLKEKQEKDREIEMQNRDDLSALLELRDIEDELSTMKKLFQQQEVTIKQMKEFYKAGGDLRPSVHGPEYLKMASDHLEDYIKRVEEMRKNTNIARKAVSLYPINLGWLLIRCC